MGRLHEGSHHWLPSVCQESRPKANGGRTRPNWAEERLRVTPSAATPKKGANAVSKNLEPKGGPGRTGPRHARDERLEAPTATGTAKSRHSANQAKPGRGTRSGWAGGVTKVGREANLENGRKSSDSFPPAAADRPTICKTWCFAAGGVARKAATTSRPNWAEDVGQGRPAARLKSAVTKVAVLRHPRTCAYDKENEVFSQVRAPPTTQLTRQPTNHPTGLQAAGVAPRPTKNANRVTERCTATMGRPHEGSHHWLPSACTRLQPRTNKHLL